MSSGIPKLSDLAASSVLRNGTIKLTEENSRGIIKLIEESPNLCTDDPQILKNLICAKTCHQILKESWDSIRNSKHAHIQAAVSQIEVAVIASCRSRKGCNKCSPRTPEGERVLTETVDELFLKLFEQFNTRDTFGDVIIVDVASYEELQKKWDDEALLVLWNKGIVEELELFDLPSFSPEEIRKLIGANPKLQNAVKKIDLKDSGIKTIPKEIKWFTQLESLDLSNNQISILLNGIFSNCPQLDELHLNGNQISILPRELFANCSNLSTLCLNDNLISSLPQCLFANCPRLSILRLDDNWISRLPKSIFAKNPNLSTLNFDYNWISSLPEGLFDNCSQLSMLCFDDNQISSLPERLFDNCPQLSMLCLDDNQISSLPEGLFSKCPELSMLCLSNNRILSMPRSIFANHSSEVDVLLEGNPIFETWVKRQ